jgi:hypothetical protein
MFWPAGEGEETAEPANSDGFTTVSSDEGEGGGESGGRGKGEGREGGRGKGEGGGEGVGREARIPTPMDPLPVLGS